MLKSDREFWKSHGRYMISSKSIQHPCPSEFNYEKISGNIPIEEERLA